MFYYLAVAPPKKRSESGSPESQRGQWIKGILDLCVLGLMGGDEHYGYELAGRFEKAGLGPIKGGTLYPKLRAMEDAGLLASRWHAGDGGPGRRYYRVTDAGHAHLRQHAPVWLHFTNAAQAVVGHSARTPDQPPAPTTPAAETT